MAGSLWHPAAMTTGQARWDGPRRPAGYAASKVPLITVYFWIIKLLTTAMGEATSDYMVRTINPVTAVLLGFTGFVIAMVLQFRAKAYNAGIYWLAVVMVAVFGTQAADVLHIKFGVPYIAPTAFYAVVLAVIFVLWYRTEGTLSIHSIRTPRREAFYWATVLATFAMGTATGDLTAKTLNLGYLASGIWFSIAFAAVAVAHWKFRLNPILAFWIAYVLTRPVGASFADYIAFPHSVGGLGVGHGPVALALTVVIAILVGYLAVTRKDVEDPRQVTAPAASARHRQAGQQPGYSRGSQPVPPRAPRPDPPLHYPGQYQDERYPAGRGQGQRCPRQQYADEQRYPDQRYPDQRRYPDEQYSGERDQEQRYPGRRYPEEQHRTQQYPGGRYRDERYPGQRHPQESQPREPWPAQERRPSRLARQPPEPWPDEDEAEHTAWGFFMWDDD